VPALDPAFATADSGARLVAFRLTTLLPSRHSVLGLNWSHILGDGYACNLFIQHLSRIYAHGKDAIPLEQYPTFWPHVSLPEHVSGETKDKYRLTQVEPVSMGALVEAYTEAGAREEGVLIKLTPGEVDAIRAECQLDGTVKVSDQDILSGWWATLLERAGERLERIIYVINVCRPPNFD
jgi:hypothetical protein